MEAKPKHLRRNAQHLTPWPNEFEGPAPASQTEPNHGAGELKRDENGWLPHVHLGPVLVVDRLVPFVRQFCSLLPQASHGREEIAA